MIQDEDQNPLFADSSYRGPRSRRWQREPGSWEDNGFTSVVEAVTETGTSANAPISLARQIKPRGDLSGCRNQMSLEAPK